MYAKIASLNGCHYVSHLFCVSFLQMLPVQNLEDLAAQNTYKYGTIDGAALNNLFMVSVMLSSLNEVNCQTHLNKTR